MAVLAIAGQLLVQHVLATQYDNGRVVNQAGLQRMLSQRLTLKLLLLDQADPSERTERVREIQELSAKWQSAHAELVSAAHNQASDEPARAALLTLLGAVQRSQGEIAVIAEAVTAGAPLTPRQRQTLLEKQEVFLPLMDATVGEFERSGAARVAWLQRVELGLLGLTLVVLAIEAAFVFRPAVAQLRKTLEELEGKRQESHSRLVGLRHLSGGIAHHFNNILTSIMGNAELIRLESAEHERRREFAEAQIEQCQRAANVIKQLLLYAGERDLQVEPIPLGGWLREVLRRMPGDELGLTVSLEIREDAVANIDVELLGQAVEGLVANACEASVERPTVVRVTLDQTVFGEPRPMAGPHLAQLPAGLYACVRVADQGIGISRGEIDRIFDPFYSQKSFGRGMGLASILGVAHAHQGGVEAESSLGQGTTITVYLPVTMEVPESVSEAGQPRDTPRRRF